MHWYIHFWQMGNFSYSMPCAMTPLLKTHVPHLYDMCYICTDNFHIITVYQTFILWNNLSQVVECWLTYLHYVYIYICKFIISQLPCSWQYQTWYCFLYHKATGSVHINMLHPSLSFMHYPEVFLCNLWSSNWQLNLINDARDKLLNETLCVCDNMLTKG